MPGFDCQRFINTKELYEEELMCNICLALCDNPYVTHCCKQLYCYDCIKEWLKCSNTCPYDRSVLKLEDLTKSSKHSQTMENLQIRCEYESFGCERIVKLKDLSQHLDNCVYNPDRKCNVCGLVMGDKHKHDCIQLLLIENQKYRHENMVLKSDINDFKQTLFDDERHCWDDPLWCM